MNEDLEVAVLRLRKQKKTPKEIAEALGVELRKVRIILFANDKKEPEEVTVEAVMAKLNRMEKRQKELLSFFSDLALDMIDRMDPRYSHRSIPRINENRVKALTEKT